MSATANAHNESDNHDEHDDHGPMKLWPFFLALLALTACEVGLYEYWRSTATIPEGGGDKVYFIPKFALIWIILVFTLPKAYIVLVYFMHLKFEKLIVVVLALVPLGLLWVCVLPTLTDTATLKSDSPNKQETIGVYGDYKAQLEADKAKASGDATGAGDKKAPPPDDDCPY
jgi:cytochrome c oxidase subunit IV